jgi:hypothetical protein
MSKEGTSMLRIELDRGFGWQSRGEGPIPADTTMEAIRQHVDRCCIQHPHRALVDGVEVYARGKLSRKELKALFGAV